MDVLAKIWQTLYQMQVKYAGWVFRGVALNIGCDFDSMVNILRDELKDDKALMPEKVAKKDGPG